VKIKRRRKKMEKTIAICENCGAKNSVEKGKEENALCGNCGSKLNFYKEPVQGTDEGFQKEVLESKRPVLVDFWAPWCMPCKMVAPILHEIQEEYSGRLKVVKINTDENQEVASNYGIMGIPTLILFNNGQEVDRVVGAVPKKKIQQMLETSNANL